MAAYARATKYFVLAGLALMLFVSIVSYFGSKTDSMRDYTSNSGDILGGAVAQNQGHGKPGPYKISDPAGVNDPRPPEPEKPKVVASAPPATNNANNQPGQPKVDDPNKSHKKYGIYPVAPDQQTFEVKDDIVYDPQGPRPSQVVLLMAGDGKGHNGGIPDLIPQVTKNRQEYADYHGYNFHFINISKYNLPGNVHPVWKKLPSIVETFNTYPDAQWIWWLDLDAIIMEPEVDLNSRVLSHEAIRKNYARGEELLADREKHTRVYTKRDPKPEDIDLIMAQDPNGLNAGSFFIRRSKFSQMLLDIWFDPIFQAATWDGKEQMALQHLTFNHPVIRDHISTVPQRLLNAFAVGWENMGWFEGDLVVHMAGCWTHKKCAENWNNYWPRRKTVESLRAKKEADKLESERKSAEEKTVAIDDNKVTAAEEGQARPAGLSSLEEEENSQLRRNQKGRTRRARPRYSARTSRTKNNEDD